ncbi:hypothetical protein SEUCBS139899_002704 [Sporothrix eucalyptigena]|uniref:Uncharacterized protein n=1 Tax=Sporothrix eucalyptigena TaxID=1812306 RepID=A0ABP0BAQ1_9PEZI
MGKVIILAGAPDAASLDWSAVEPGAETATALQRWNSHRRNSDDNTEASASGHPQWRAVPAKGIADEKQAPQPDAIQAKDGNQDKLASAAHGAAANSWSSLYGRAEFMALMPATQESTQRSTQDGGVCLKGSFGQSTFDETSLSVRVPDALPGPSIQLPQQPYPASYQASFGSTTISQEFIEHSLAVHDALPSSLSPFDPPEVQRPASFDETTMSPSQLASISFLSTAPPLPADIPRWQPLTHLVDVPGAAYLLSLAPQTVTVNLVVAIVSVGAPRVIGNDNSNNKNRRCDRPPVLLVELVVGDETRSGFGLTIWLDGGPRTTGSSSLAGLLPTLAPHDVVLLRHVALHVFGDKVYGSSLRKDQTKMHILHRGRSGLPRTQEDPAVDTLFLPAHLAAAAHLNAQDDPSLPTAWHLLDKTARVRNWALRYVLVDYVAVGGEKDVTQNAVEGIEHEECSKTTPAWMLPPADTQ